MAETRTDETGHYEVLAATWGAGAGRADRAPGGPRGPARRPAAAPGHRGGAGVPGDGRRRHRAVVQPQGLRAAEAEAAAATLDPAPEGGATRAEAGLRTRGAAPS